MQDRSKAKVLGIIPARGGSKRVQGKNLRKLNSRPLLSYTIDSALACTDLDHVILTSDNEDIISCAREFGLDVPFVRPVELAQDDTPDRPVLQHALNFLSDESKLKFDLLVLLRPTAPFRKSSLISACVNQWKSSQADSVRSMSKAEGIHHPYWMFKEEDGMAKELIEGKTIQEFYQSQLLPPVYHLNGVVDAIATDVVLNHEQLYGDQMGILDTPADQAFDIDTESDLRYAEFLMSR